jgi:NADPH:quinone reductase-like Zn-dependent oxidoreductase
MRCHQLYAPGLQNLRGAEVPDPVPHGREVLVKIRTVSLNYRDLIEIDAPSHPLPFPFIPLSDAVGEVIAIGPDVTRVQAGQRVCPNFMLDWYAGELDLLTRKSLAGTNRPGVLCQLGVYDERSLSLMPEHLSDAQCAAAPCAGLTAWSAVVSEGRLQPGETVVITGTGGVAVWALQFAARLGARVIVLSSSQAKLERAQALARCEGVNYREHPQWDQEVRRLTAGRGADLIIDAVGGSGLAPALRAAAFGGRIAMIGIIGGMEATLPITLAMAQRIRLLPITVGSRSSFDEMNRAIATFRLAPVIDRTYPFEQARDACVYLKSAAHFGKVCIDIP